MTEPRNHARLGLLLCGLALALAVALSVTAAPYFPVAATALALLRAAAIALMLLIAFTCTGAAVFGPLRGAAGTECELRHRERWVLLACTGSAIVSTLLAPLWIAGVAPPAVLAGTLGAGTIAGLLRLGVIARVAAWARNAATADLLADDLAPRIPARRRGLPATWAEVLLLAAVVLAALLAAAASLTPPLLYDVTEYQLGAVRHYERTAGGLRLIPVWENFYARFPFPINALYFLGLDLERPGDFAPKLLNLAALAGIVLLLDARLARWGVARALRFLGALLLLAHPVVLELQLDAYIDLAAALYLLAALHALDTWRRAPEPDGARPLFLAAALLFGQAFAAKYTALQLYLLPVIVCVAPWALAAAARARAWGLVAAGLALAAVPLTVWLGKNTWFYGNPLEPFFVKWFRPGDAAAIAREEFYLAAHWPQSVLSPDYWRSFATRLGRLEWFWLAPLAGAVALRARRDGAALRLLAFAALSYLLWNLVRESQLRFLAPTVVLLVAVAMRVLDRVTPPAGWPRVLIGGLLAAAACAHLTLHAIRLGGGGVFDYVLSPGLAESSRSDWRDGHPRAEFYRHNLGGLGEVLIAANTQLPRGARVFLVYEARPYLLAHEAGYNTVFDESLLLLLAEEAPNTGGIAAALRNAGYTHLLVNEAELVRFVRQYSQPMGYLGEDLTGPDAPIPPTAELDDYYPPYMNDARWPAQREAVRALLARARTAAIAAAGPPGREVWLAPIP